jgi:hypothetical protein
MATIAAPSRAGLVHQEIAALQRRQQQRQQPFHIGNRMFPIPEFARQIEAFPFFFSSASHESPSVRGRAHEYSAMIQNFSAIVQRYRCHIFPNIAAPHAGREDVSR